jgi:hypothetical protein
MMDLCEKTIGNLVEGLSSIKKWEIISSVNNSVFLIQVFVL